MHKRQHYIKQEYEAWLFETKGLTTCYMGIAYRIVGNELWNVTYIHQNEINAAHLNKHVDAVVLHDSKSSMAVLLHYHLQRQKEGGERASMTCILPLNTKVVGGGRVTVLDEITIHVTPWDGSMEVPVPC